MNDDKEIVELDRKLLETTKLAEKLDNRIKECDRILEFLDGREIVIGDPKIVEKIEKLKTKISKTENDITESLRAQIQQLDERLDNCQWMPDDMQGAEKYDVHVGIERIKKETINNSLDEQISELTRKLMF